MNKEEKGLYGERLVLMGSSDFRRGEKKEGEKGQSGKRFHFLIEMIEL